MQPKAHRTGVTVSETGDVTIRVNTPPERDKANAAVMEALAHAPGMPWPTVEMVRGHTASDKVVMVEGLTQEEAMSRLLG